MRTAVLIGLLVWAPSIASAQQDQTVVNRVLGNVPDLVTSVVDAEIPQGFEQHRPRRNPGFLPVDQDRHWTV